MVPKHCMRCVRTQLRQIVLSFVLHGYGTATWHLAGGAHVAILDIAAVACQPISFDAWSEYPSTSSPNCESCLLVRKGAARTRRCLSR